MCVATGVSVMATTLTLFIAAGTTGTGPGAYGPHERRFRTWKGALVKLVRVASAECRLLPGKRKLQNELRSKTDLNQRFRSAIRAEPG
jgi:hypothetical protein